MSFEAKRGARGLARLSALAIAAAVSCAAPARGDIIDTFTAVEGGNPDFVQTIGVAFGTPVDFTIAPAVTDPIGSRRRLTVDQFVGGNSATLTIDGTSGAASMAATSLAASEFKIHYGIGFPGLHYDATAGGAANGFRLTFSSFDPDLEYVIAAYGYTGSGTSNSGTYQSLSSVVEVPFSSFSNFANIGFHDLNQIEIRIRDSGLTRGGTAELIQFETAAIPEPGSLVLAGLAALGLWPIARRKKSLNSAMAPARRAAS